MATSSQTTRSVKGSEVRLLYNLCCKITTIKMFSTDVF